MVEVMGERECNATSEEQAAQLHASAQARRAEAERTAQETAADAILDAAAGGEGNGYSFTTDEHAAEGGEPSAAKPGPPQP